MTRMSGKTQIFSVIGTPVTHSISPLIHTESFSRLGVDAVFNAFTVDLDTLEESVRALKTLGIRGYSVTMPLKTKVLPYLDGLSDAARLMHAVNVVHLQDDGQLIGHDTDGAGFMQNLADHGVDTVGKTMTIVGAGGAGSAIFTQAALDGVSTIHVFNPVDEFFAPSQERIASIASETGTAMALRDLADEDALKEAIAASDVLVNATRVGMAPNTDAMVVPEDVFREDLAVADTVYNPRVSKLLRHAQQAGARTVDGLGMLIWQAAIAEKIWLGVDMPVEEITALVAKEMNV